MSSVCLAGTEPSTNLLTASIGFKVQGIDGFVPTSHVLPYAEPEGCCRLSCWHLLVGDFRKPSSFLVLSLRFLSMPVCLLDPLEMQPACGA